jgi:myo-inositol-1(or 4)-monophosphatase
MPNIGEYAEFGETVAREAGRILLEHFRTDFAVEHKGTVNLVTEVDLAAEEWIVSRIRKAFPSHSILAEEKHNSEPAGDIRWVIDPLDGTTNYAHGYPAFCVSIGLEVGGELQWGGIFDPVRDELYTARSGGGSFCNGVPLHVSKVAVLDASLLATGFPYDIRTDSQTNLENFCAFALRTQGLRRSGSAALDFCGVAAGRLDGFWELKLNPWDCAAGYMMVREAGGMVTNFRGQPGSIYDREVVASNNLIHEEILAALETTRKRIRDSRFEIRDY